MITYLKRVGYDFDGVLLPTYEELARLSDIHFGTNFAPFQREDWSHPDMAELWIGDAARTSFSSRLLAVFTIRPQWRAP